MKKLPKYKKAVILLLGILICLLVFLLWRSRTLTVTEYTIDSGEIPSAFDGFRIVHISDLHNTSFGKDNARLVSEIRALSPDIIVITGDIVHSSPMENAVSFSRQAAAIAPTYYIPGNHELRMDHQTLFSRLQEAGVILLLNENTEIIQNGQTINLAGLQDPAATPNMTIKDALQPLIREDAYNILLAHRPERIDSYAACGADLVLSGHTHGGQFHLPFLGALYATGQGFFPVYDVGLFSVGDTQLLISQGLGPYRFGNPPEIVVITLKSRK